MTRRKRAHVVAAALLVFSILLCALAVGSIATGRVCITSADRSADAYAAELPVPANESSEVCIASKGASGDADLDGVSDGEDILNSALAYVETRPRYRSAYYANGYPDDGCGVCTDLVAIALRGAGWDLQRLIAEDVAADPEAYPGIDIPDAAIDFRRVPNQLSYFKRHAVSLTCDIADIASWQPGDIAVFNEHVGIISDRRNTEGVPYLIHHSSPFQLAYEEDCLADYGEVVGHFRMS